MSEPRRPDPRQLLASVRQVFEVSSPTTVISLNEEETALVVETLWIDGPSVERIGLPSWLIPGFTQTVADHHRGLALQSEEAAYDADPDTAADGAASRAVTSSPRQYLAERPEDASLRLERHPSFCTLTALTPKASAWLQLLVTDDAEWINGALIIEERYLPDVADAAFDAGFRFDGQATWPANDA